MRGRGDEGLNSRMFLFHGMGGVWVGEGHETFITWPQLGPFFVPARPPLTAINGY